MSAPGHRWLVYGAYGYTGRLIVEQALERGLRPVLAGRDAARVEMVGREFGLETRHFSLDDPERVRAGIRGMALVLHAAGPFSATWRPMVEACLAEGAHYLDITGEIGVLEGMRELDGRARDAGVHCVPAVGFDVVPTDCAAAMAVRAARGRGGPFGEASGSAADDLHLDLAFHLSGGPSRGTLKTTLERLGQSGAVRRGGEIVTVPLASVRKRVDFSDRARRGVAIPWGDVSTAYYSTGVGNIRVFATVPAVVAGVGRWLGPLLRAGPIRWLLEWLVDRFATGPDRAELEGGFSRVRAEVWREAPPGTRKSGARAERAAGSTSPVAVVELTGPNAYTLTATAAIGAAERLLAGEVEAGPGVHTPSNAFGADFVTSLSGVEVVHREPAP